MPNKKLAAAKDAKQDEFTLSMRTFSERSMLI